MMNMPRGGLRETFRLLPVDSAAARTEIKKNELALSSFLQPRSCPSKNRCQLSELALPAHHRPLGPFVAVHAVESKYHPHTVLSRMELDHGRNIVGLDTRNEVRQMRVREALQGDNFGISNSRLDRQRHSRSLHELDLRRSDRGHFVTHLTARTKVELQHLRRETTRSPPRLEAFLRRP